MKSTLHKVRESYSSTAVLPGINTFSLISWLEHVDAPARSGVSPLQS